MEAEGSFYLNKDPIRPGFQILLTATQEFLLDKIKQYLEDNLGFDSYSAWFIKNSSVISINIKKARDNSKPTVMLNIRDIRILHNYLIPYFSMFKFVSKKKLDFIDFKTICQVVYKGAHKDNIIKALIIKLSESMNDFRLSNYKGKIPKQIITQADLNKLDSALPLSEHLFDGRVRDITTGNIDYNNESSIYLISRLNSTEELLVKSLKETADLVGIHYETLSKHLNIRQYDKDVTKINNYLIKRIKVFYK
ncbi:hypothetical protein B8V09_03510 [Streptococcus agalactiae]|nr:hypothetical protein B8V09_03510 [Streptococcus agalactiae]